MYYKIKGEVSKIEVDLARYNMQQADEKLSQYKGVKTRFEKKDPKEVDGKLVYVQKRAQPKDELIREVEPGMFFHYDIKYAPQGSKVKKVKTSVDESL